MWSPSGSLRISSGPTGVLIMDIFETQEGRGVFPHTTGEREPHKPE